MSDVDPQRDRESIFRRRSLHLVNTGPARGCRLARSARSPAHAEPRPIFVGAPDSHKLLRCRHVQRYFIQGVYDINL